MSTIDELRKVRIEKLEALKKKGVNAYPATVVREQTVGIARDSLGKTVSIVGRLMAVRGHGKIVFADVVDASGKIQVVFKEDILDASSFSIVELLDIGDFVEARGKVEKTQAGEVSIFASSTRIISKAVLPLPDRWYGLKDVEERYRKRYLDMLMNPKVKQVLDARWRIEQSIRTFLWGEGYCEVETPVLQPLYGGTNAKPFTTHMNALTSDFYLRLAPELYLKRLIVGGYERIFEIARNFRNEGIDLTHQPEFTMMEFYEAYADYIRIMDLTEELIKHAAQAANQSYIVQVGEHAIDISGKWKRITIDEALKKYAQIDWETISDSEVQSIIEKNNIEVRGKKTKDKALFAIYDHFVTSKLIEPTWVIDYPRDVSPLSKEHRTKRGRVERFEGYIGGKELCDGWSEIVSGLEQRDRFEQEQRNMKAGDVEAHPLDEDFITALEHGCPPLGGIGIGIDRLVMFLTNTWAIREVIAFPTLRPEVSMSNQVKAGIAVKPEEPVDPTQTLTKEKAHELLHAHMQNTNLRRHCYAVGAVMRSLAKKLGGNEDLWEVMGILHDADWEETKDTPEHHTIKTLSWLKELGITKGPLVHAFQSHNRKHTNLAQLDGLMEWSLETCDELTGFIVAVALVRPDKKLVTVSVDSIIKKWKTKEFAKAVDRDQIAQCEEKLGIPLLEFITVALTAMQEIHKELGL